MNNKVATNLAFIILLVFLSISGFKSLLASGVFSNNAPSSFGNLTDFKDFAPGKKKEAEENTIVLRDFDEIQQNERPTSQTIDRATASNYTKTRPLSGTEILELGKIHKIARHLNTDKKIVIYVNKGSDRDVQAFITEFAKVREEFKGNSRYVFYPLDSMWDLNDTYAKNSHDRVIINFKKDCGLVCIIDTKALNMTRMKGYNVNKKSAQIMGVMLK